MKTAITITFLCFYIFTFGQIQSIYNNFDDSFDKYDLMLSGKIDNKYLFVRKNNSRIDLVVSDGTAQGTTRLDQFLSWSNVFFKNKLYYQKSVNGRIQMFVTDGTADSTFMFLDSINNHRFLLATSEDLFFMKNNQLWKTDGTLSNTYPIMNATPSNFKVFLGKVYFTANDTEWMVEGNSVNISNLSSILNNFSPNGVTLNGIYYSRSYDATHGFEFWRTDGTAQGTYLVKDLIPESYSNNTPRHGMPKAFTVIDSLIYFVAENGIWKSDGTTAGTVLVKPIEDANRHYFFYLLLNDEYTHGVINGKYFVEIATIKFGNEFWISDGTTDGTFVLDIFKGSGNGLKWFEEEPVAILDNHLYFAANNGQFGEELWRTDGTIEGTTIVKDITPGVKGSSVIDIKTINDKLFFINQSENKENTALYVMDKNALLSPTTIDYPKLDWVKIIGGAIHFSSENMTNQDLELDNDGNVYVAGQSHYEYPIAFFGEESWIIDRTDDNDINFVAKYDAAGNLQWQNYTKGDYNEPMHLAVDNAQNVIVGGSTSRDTWYDYDIQFYGDNRTITPSTPIIYLVKLNANGEKEWQVFFEQRRDQVKDIIIDESNNIYVLLEKTLLKYDTNGNLVWKNDLTTTGTKRDGALRLFDQFLYLTASTHKSTSAIGYSDAKFIDVMKYTLDGQLVWAKNVSASGFIALKDFEISTQGQLNVIGEYAGNLTASFYKIASSEVNTQKRASYFFQMDKDGRVLKLINDTTASLNNIVFNDQQEYYIESEKRNSFAGANAYEGFENFRDFPKDYGMLSVTKYDYLHRPIENRSFYPGSPDNNTKIRLTPDDKIILSGSFSEQFDTLPFYPRNYARNIHVLKFELHELPTPEPIPAEETEQTVHIFPNPSNGIVNVQVIASDFINYRLQIFDATGKQLDYFEKLHEAEYETHYLKNYPSGIYFFQFQNGQETVIKKVIIIRG